MFGEKINSTYLFLMSAYKKLKHGIYENFRLFRAFCVQNKDIRVFRGVLENYSAFFLFLG